MMNVFGGRISSKTPHASFLFQQELIPVRFTASQSVITKWDEGRGKRDEGRGTRDVGRNQMSLDSRLPYLIYIRLIIYSCYHNSTLSKYYIIAGEASGDLHGGNLIRAIKQKDSSAEVRCWGGDNMQAAGAQVVKHIRDLAFMGFYEVLKNLPQILRNISFCKQDILMFKPDVVVLIDYPGFNFRLLEFLHENSFRIVWYISPQVWAWKEGRVKKIKQYVDKLLVIFPFEVDFYKKWNVEATFVGHPLLDVIETNATNNRNENIIALLPGSRKQEIEKMLPLYVEVAKRFPEKKFIVAGMSIHGEAYYQNFLENVTCELWFDKTYDLLKIAHAAIVTSGTATMETALYNVPQVVCYKGSALSFFIGRMLVKIPFIAMVNLVCGKKVVAELIQHQATTDAVTAEVEKLLQPETRTQIIADYSWMKEHLGGAGASARAAEEIVKIAQRSDF